MTPNEPSPTPRWSQRLQRSFNVEPAETVALVLLLIHGFAKGLTFVYFETTANASFLAAYGPELLPYVYVTVALVSTLMGLAITRVESRLSPPRFLSLTLVFLLGSIILAWLLLTLVPARWPAFVLMVWKDVIFIVVELVFWAVAGYLFNVRQGKRLFGLAGAGAIIAGIIGGLCAPAVIAVLGKTQLLAVAAVGALAMLITLKLITRRFPARFTIADDETPDADWSLRALAGRRYVVLLAVFSVLSFYCYYTVDLAFYGEVQRRWQDPEALASFFGIFYAALNTVMLLTSGFVAGRLILRFGLPISLLLVPLLEVGGTLSALAAMLWAGGALLALMIVVKLLDEVARATFEGTAYRLIYQAMPAGVRLRVQAIRESIVEPVAVGVSGLIFLAATELIGLDSRQLLLALLVVLPVWIFVAVLLRRSYTIELGKTLAERNLNRGDLDLNDKATRGALERALGGDAHEAIYAIDLLEELPNEELPQYLTIALDNRSPEVRAAALRQAADHRIRDLADQTRRLAVADPSPAVRGAALEVLGILGPAQAAALAPEHMDAPEPEVRAGALAGMLKAAPGCADRALERLAQLALADAPGERLFAADVMATAAEHNHQPAAQAAAGGPRPVGPSPCVQGRRRAARPEPAAGADERALRPADLRRCPKRPDRLPRRRRVGVGTGADPALRQPHRSRPVAAASWRPAAHRQPHRCTGGPRDLSLPGPLWGRPPPPGHRRPRLLRPPRSGRRARPAVAPDPAGDQCHRLVPGGAGGPVPAAPGVGRRPHGRRTAASRRLRR
jgi:AAA family ATP:ADP antiporter